jgi:V8-like Glu-specific endopeptidase
MTLSDQHSSILRTVQNRCVSHALFTVRTLLALGVPCVTTIARANGEYDPIPSYTYPLNLETGGIAGAGEKSRLVYSTVIEVPEAPWIRIFFDEATTELRGLPRGDDATYMRLTSLHDGKFQILNADTLAQWRFSSAYFNGSAVRLEVFAPKGAGAAIGLLHAHAGVIPGGVASICGPTDDRIPSSDPRVNRMMPVGCTSWLFNNHPNALLSAGHCFDGTNADVVEFDVPASLPNGTVQHPGPEDQYAIDPASVQFANVAIGNDWSHFGAFSNSTTGLSPLIAQGGASFLTVAPSSTPVIRITGFGVDAGPANQTNQTHTGPFESISGTMIRYQTDTTGGNSGSPVIRNSDGATLGIHTNAGCFDSGGGVGGANHGTTLANTGVMQAIANPLGIAAAGTSCGLGNSSCYLTHATPHCSDATCCVAVCAVDAFCCNTNWDALCVTQAWDLCTNCGDPGAGNCEYVHATPGCADETCCQLVCLADPFCCNTEWDNLCANRAQASCGDGLSCATAPVFLPSFPATFSINTAFDFDPSDESPCGTNDVWSNWRRYRPTCSGLATVALCSPTADNQSTIAIFKFCDGQAILCRDSDSGCADPNGVTATFAALAGETYWVRFSAIASTDTAGIVTLNCDGMCGTGGSCFETHEPGCADAECCVSVCESDPWCCTVAWDSICVGEAWNLCTVCGDPETGSCGQAHIGPGCSDVACCANVCSVDAFCCDTRWDVLCAMTADSLCIGYTFGDINGDGVVNAADLSSLLSAWGTTTANLADLDGNGIVGASDLSLLLSNWD